MTVLGRSLSFTFLGCCLLLVFSFFYHFSPSTGVVPVLGGVSMEIWRGNLLFEKLCSRNDVIRFCLNHRCLHDRAVPGNMPPNDVTNSEQPVTCSETDNCSMDYSVSVCYSFSILHTNVLCSRRPSYERTIRKLSHV